MSSIKRIAVLLAAFVAIGFVSQSFKGSNVLDRAIILGMGIDFDDDQLVLTAEIVSPGNGEEQVGTFSKTVTVRGDAIGQCIQYVAEQTGKEASLGQCVVVVLGQNYFEQRDFSDTVNYLINSDSFKESAVICCCSGSAEYIFNNGNAMSQSVSMSIAAMLLDQAENVAVSSNNLLDYTRSQHELDRTGYLNLITFVPSANSDAQQPDKVQGYFTYSKAAIFRQSKFVCYLDETDVMGKAVFDKDVSGDSFVVYDDGMAYTLKATHKKTDLQVSDNAVNADITLYVSLARTDSAETNGFFNPQNKKLISDEMLEQVRQRAQQLAQSFWDKQVRYNFDLLDVHKVLKRKQGESQALSLKPMSDFTFTLTVSVKEG